MPTMKLKDLHITKLLQPRGGDIDKDVVRDYSTRAKAGDKFPPLLAYKITDRKFPGPALVAGFHRHAAFKEAEIESADVEVKEGTFAEAWLAGYLSNITNGVRYSNAQKRAAVEQALMLFKDESAKSIADRLHVTHPFVQKIRDELVSVGKLEATEKVKRSDGVEVKSKRQRQEICNDYISKDKKPENKQSAFPFGANSPADEVEDDEFDDGEEHASRHTVSSLEQVASEFASNGDYESALETQKEADGIREALEEDDQELADALMRQAYGDDDTPQPEILSTPKGEIVIDPFKRVVPNGIGDYFGSTVWQEVIKDAECAAAAIETVRFAVEKAHRTPWLYIDCGKIRNNLVDLRNELVKQIDLIRTGLPYALCGLCEGKKCQHCRNSGYVTKGMTDLEPELYAGHARKAG